jgi:hypothetical protein
LDAVTLEPDVSSFSAADWIPACAGMTKPGNYKYENLPRIKMALDLMMQEP